MSVATADTGVRRRSQQAERCAYARSSGLCQEASKVASSTAEPSASENGLLIGRSTAHKQLMEKLEKVAPTDAEVLVSGPTGVGKELYANYFHQHSARAKASFVPVNCGGLPVELIENELFGHVGGAFTGARPQSDGLVVAAEGGTLFFDEIDSLPLACQAKLLRFLQDKDYRRRRDALAACKCAGRRCDQCRPHRRRPRQVFP